MTARLASRIGLRGRLILPMLAAFAALASVVVWQSLEDRAERIESAKMHLLHNAQLIAAQQRFITAHADALLRELAQRPELRPGAPTGECARLLAERLGQETGFINIGKVLPDGSLACAAVPPKGPVSYADRTWLREALKSEAMAVGDVVTGHIIGKPLVTFARAVRDNAGRNSAVLFLALDLEWLQRELANARLPEGARLVVVDTKGTVAVRHPDPEGWVGKNVANTAQFQIVAVGGEGVAEEIGLDGVRRLYAYTPLLDTASGRLTLWLSVPRATVLAPANRDLVVGLSASLAALLLALGLAYWAGEKILVLPLLALSDTAARFGAGDHAARTGLPHTGDEIGRLARTLDETADRIEAAERRLTRVNRALRVLSAGNRALLRGGEEQALLEEMCRAIVEAGGYRLAWVGYAENDPERSVRFAAAWGEGIEIFGGQKITWNDGESGQNLIGAAIRRLIPITANDVQTDQDCAPWRPLAQAHGIASLLAMPLRNDGAAIGALCICSAEAGDFDAEVVELLNESADDLAYGIVVRRAEAEHERTRSDLRRQEARNTLILKAAGEGIFGLDGTGCVTFANPAACAMLQWQEEELIGRVIHPLHHHTRADGTPFPEAECPIYQAFRDGITHFADDDLFWRKDGTSFPVEYVSTPIHDDQGEPVGAVVSFLDTTARKQDKIALERLNRALRTLSAGNEALVRATDEAGLLEAACRVIVEKGGYRMAWVGFTDDTPEKTVTPKGWAGAEEGYLAQLHLTWADTEHGQGPNSRAIRSGEPQIVHDLLADPGYTPWRKLAEERGFVSAFAYPLRVSGKVIGALGIYAAEADAFDAGEVVLLSELGDDLAYGIETLRTRAERDRIAYEHTHHAEILRHSLEDALRAIAFTVEKRDPYTAGHERRVGELAVAIAEEMGLPEEKTHGIRLAATVHDLGKIQIPAEILAKPTRLSEIEFMLIKTHPQAGFDILKDVKFPWPIADIVWQHHERLDGTGYPQGLKDGHILLESRIMAVADVVEAMASHRPYRPALGIEVALKEIERGRGSAYDQVVADACLKLFREGKFAFQS